MWRCENRRNVRLLSAQPWGFASPLEQQVAPRKHSGIDALHLECSQAKPSFFLYDRLYRQPELVLFFVLFFFKAVYCFSSHYKTLRKVNCDVCVKKKKEKKKIETHIFIFGCCVDLSIEPVHLVPQSYTDLSQQLDPGPQLWNQASPSLRHPKDGIFFSWPWYFHCIRHGRDFNMKKREKNEMIVHIISSWKVIQPWRNMWSHYNSAFAICVLCSFQASLPL